MYGNNTSHRELSFPALEIDSINSVFLGNGISHNFSSSECAYWLFIMGIDINPTIIIIAATIPTILIIFISISYCPPKSYTCNILYLLLM